MSRNLCLGGLLRTVRCPRFSIDVCPGESLHTALGRHRLCPMYGHRLPSHSQTQLPRQWFPQHSLWSDAWKRGMQGSLPGTVPGLVLDTGIRFFASRPSSLAPSGECSGSSPATTRFLTGIDYWKTSARRSTCIGQQGKKKSQGRICAGRAVGKRQEDTVAKRTLGWVSGSEKSGGHCIEYRTNHRRQPSSRTFSVVARRNCRKQI